MANSNGWGDGAANNAIGWGQGANNAIGWGSSHATSWAGATDIVGLDSSASAFISAAGITDATQISAINNLVVGMKADGIWTKMKAVYPFVGGTATTHKYNLKDPRDLDAAFRLVFNGGWTHSSNGATPNGTNGYADTKLNQSTNLSNDSVHLCYYSRTNSSVNSFDIGGNSGLPNYYGAQIASYYTSIGTIGHLNSYPIDSTVSTAFSDTRAFYLASRISATSNKLFRNASLLNTNTTTRTSTLANVNFRLASDAVGFTNREAAFASIGNGLTDTEASNLYTRVQQFNTTLLRQV